MHVKLQLFVSNLEPKGSEHGVHLHSQEVIRGLHFAANEPQINSLLDRDYEIADATRVYFSGKINWIDIAVKLESPSDSQNVIITYDAHQNEVVSVSFTKKPLAHTEGELPFILDVESHALNVVASEKLMSRLETRRSIFTKSIIAALIPVLGNIRPAMARTTTPYTTTSQTCSNTSEQTSRGTSGLTTPNDNDTRTDTNIDNHQDCHTDSVQDTRDDS
jgi:hypothetical protein